MFDIDICLALNTDSSLRNKLGFSESFFMSIFLKEESMPYKRRMGLALLFVFLTFPLSASMVSFLLVETGLGEDVTSSQYTSLWEGALMAVFFDAGHIVTNSPFTRIEKLPAMDLAGQMKDDFNEAVNGGADYFILGFLEYKLQGDRPVPVSIVLKTYKTNSQKLVYEQRFPAGTGRNLNDEYQYAQNVGRIIISHLEDR